MQECKLPLISIIIPIYNVEDYLEECLLSLKRQTKENFEVICVNDGSTDGSLEILNAAVAEDPRFRIFNKQNGGVSSARNAGVFHSTGKYVSFVDADDWVDAQYFEKLSKFIEESGPDIIVFSGKSHPKLDWVDRTMDTSANTELVPGIDALLFHNGCVPLICNKLYRSSIIRNNGICFDNTLTLGEDLVFQFSVFPYAQTTRFVDDKLYHYRIGRVDSAMTLISDKKTQLRKHVSLLAKIIALWEYEGWTAGRELALLEATRFLFADMSELSLPDFKEISLTLLDLVENTFGNDIIMHMGLPEPKNFYTLIQKATQANSMLRNTALRAAKFRYFYQS